MRIKVLGNTTDKQLTFNEYVSVCCTKTSRDLNNLNQNSRRDIRHSFIGVILIIAHPSGIPVANIRKEPRIILVSWNYILE